MERAKKSKSDVSQEEMGKLSISYSSISLADAVQRHIECRSRLTTILWRITRTRRICDFFVRCIVLSCKASCVSPSYASDSSPSPSWPAHFSCDLSVKCMWYTTFQNKCESMRHRPSQNSSRIQAYPSHTQPAHSASFPPSLEPLSALPTAQPILHY